MLKEYASKERLLFFGNGNEGHQETNFIQYFHWLNNKNINNLISVTSALNSYGDNLHLKRNSDGSITGDFVNAPFVNLCKYYEDYTITAPGWNIFSADATNNKGYLMLKSLIEE